MNKNKYKKDPEMEKFRRTMNKTFKKPCKHEYEKLVFKEWLLIYYSRKEILVCKKCGEILPLIL